MIGQTISHYQILEKLGEGGMGVVYKAQDTKLDRFVALKFLPPHVSSSSDDKARFLQEAKAVASLTHPNICTIHGVEDEDGKAFIVLEYVEGKTLKDLHEVIPLKQAIEMGIQIADGLAAAHEKGVVHRDIKPDNIMIRKDGRVQIMDFGLAKLKGVSRLTKEGSTVGTAGYMSPEQVQGQNTDHRTDIFSLGVVLYELFTGESPFKGVHETAITYEIVNVDPVPLSAAKPDIDPQLDAIVLECLEKEPAERYQSIAEVGKDLRRFKRESSRTRVSRVSTIRNMSQSGATKVAPAGEQGTPWTFFSKERIIWSTAIIVLLGAVLTFALVHFREMPPEVRTFRAMIMPPEKTIFSTTFGGHIDVSPDGHMVALVARDSTGKSLLWVRPLNSLVARPLSGTEEASYPFWSPDSRFIGFFSGNKMKRIDASGGPAQTICDATAGRGGAWGQDGTILFAPHQNASLLRVAAAGGIPTAVTKLDSVRHETGHRWPHFHPDGVHFFYLARTVTGGTGEADAVRLGSLRDSTMKNIVVPASSNAVFASGHLLFMREQSLMAQEFDASGLVLVGDAFPIAQEVQYDPAFGRATFTASDNGILVYQSGSTQGGTRLAWYDRSGKQLSTFGRPAIYYSPRLSPDGKRLAVDLYEAQSRNVDVWVCELARDVWSRFTFEPGVDRSPVWSRDGNTIVFYSNRKGRVDLYQRPASGAGNEDPFFESDVDKLPNDWAPDGKSFLITSTGNPRTRNDLWILTLSGDKKAIPFLQTEFNEGAGTFSPDGRWITYNSDESGKNQIYVRPFPGPGGKWQVSTAGGRQPIWSRNGKEIFFISDDNKLFSAPVRWSGATFEVGTAQPLFEVHAMPTNHPYDVTADGQRFLVNTLLGEASSGPVTLVINWDAEVKK